MLKKLFALVGVTAVAAGAGAAYYHKRVKDSGLTFDEKLAEDKAKLQKHLAEQEARAKAKLEKIEANVIEFAEGFEEGFDEDGYQAPYYVEVDDVELDENIDLAEEK